MACLRGQAFEGRERTLQCDEEGCKLRSGTGTIREEIDGIPSETDCLLQLRLRARTVEDAYPSGRIDDELDEYEAWRSQYEWNQVDRSGPVDTGKQHGPRTPRGWEGYSWGGDTRVFVEPAEDAGSSWRGPKVNVGWVDEINETAEGIIARGFINNEYRYLVESGPSWRGGASFFTQPPFPVDTGQQFGPWPDTEGYRMLERWDRDCEVPSYVIDELRDYLGGK